MATATTIPTAPQDSSYKGVLRGRRKNPTPTLFPDVPDQRDSGPDALQPPGSRPERVGIARLASSSPLADAKRGTEYFLLPVRSILNHCDSDRVPFSWTVNPYRGCEFGCQYCYARYTHEYMELDSADFERKIYVKQDTGPLAWRDLGMEKVQGEHIAIGTATDPYQPAEREFGATRAILEQMAARKGLSVSITTKSNQVVRDLDLLLRIAAHSTVHVNLSITTLRPRLARMLEPRAPRPDLRLQAVRELRDAGIAAGVFAMPVLPGLTDAEADLDALACGARDAGATALGVPDRCGPGRADREDRRSGPVHSRQVPLLRLAGREAEQSDPAVGMIEEGSPVLRDVLQRQFADHACDQTPPPGKRDRVK